MRLNNQEGHIEHLVNYIHTLKTAQLYFQAAYSCLADMIQIRVEVGHVPSQMLSVAMLVALDKT